MPRISRTGAALLFLLVLASALHLRTFLQQPLLIGMDSREYLIAAHHLLAGDGFLNASWEPETIRTPIYPIFLAVFQALGLSLTVVVVVQHLMIIGLAAALFVFAERTTGNRVLALLAGIIFAFDRPTLAYTNLIMTESLFTVILCAIVWLVYRITEVHAAGHRITLAALSGGLGGLLVLTRPIGILYFVPVCFVVLLHLKWKGVVPAVMFAVCFLVMPVGWILRNQQTTGVATLSAIAGVNTLFFRAAGALAIEDSGNFIDNMERHQKVLFAQAQQQFRADFGEELNSVNDARRSQYFGRMGRRILLEHPGSTLRLFGRGIVMTMIPNDGPSSRSVAGIVRQPARNASILYGIISFLLALLGTRWLYRHHRVLGSLLCLTVAYFVLISAGGESKPRFRVPVEPMYALLIAAGLCHLGTLARPLVRRVTG